MNTAILYMLILGGIAAYIWSLRSRSSGASKNKKDDDEPGADEQPTPLEPRAGEPYASPPSRAGAPPPRQWPPKGNQGWPPRGGGQPR